MTIIKTDTIKPSESGKDFLLYYERRFPFFEYSLPLSLLLYPFIPLMNPLYLLPRYYGLHFLYLFLAIFNQRLLGDLQEKVLLRSRFNKSIYGLSTIGLLVFCLLFGYLEKQQGVSGLSFDWRSYFFFLSTLSVLFVHWCFIAIKKFLPNIIQSLGRSLCFSFIIIPPVALNLHSELFLTLGHVVFFIFIHMLTYELIKKENLRRGALTLYGCVSVFMAMEFTNNISSALFLLGATSLLLIFQKNIKASYLFVPGIMFSWIVFYLRNAYLA